jgi:predicted transcriptional regulator
MCMCGGVVSAAHGDRRAYITPEDIRLAVAARREAAQQLCAAGMSQRRAAKVLGVTHATIRRDVEQNVPKSGTKSSTGSAATKARRAGIAAKARYASRPSW